MVKLQLIKGGQKTVIGEKHIMLVDGEPHILDVNLSIDEETQDKIVAVHTIDFF